MQQLGSSECSKFLWLCTGFVSAEGKFIVKKNEEKEYIDPLYNSFAQHSMGKKYGED